MNKHSDLIRRMTILALFIALAVIFQWLSVYIKIGAYAINLAIVCIALAAIILGPVEGLAVGIINGISIFILALADVAPFLAINPFLTVLLVLLKTGLAGLVSGFAFKYLKKYNFVVAIIVASFLVPFVNTGLYILGTSTMFLELLGESNSFRGMGAFFLIVWSNALIEIAFTCVLTPTIIQVVKIAQKSLHLKNLETGN